MILHGLVVHSAQPGDGGVQLTEVVMLSVPLGWSHCRVTVSHDSTVATTIAGACRSTKKYSNTHHDEQLITVYSLMHINS